MDLKLYTIEVKQVEAKEVTVEAFTKEEALTIIEGDYHNGVIELNHDDYVGTFYTVMNVEQVDMVKDRDYLLEQLLIVLEALEARQGYRHENKTTKLLNVLKRFE